ncbi:MAG: hypothetical protein IJ772_05145 [Bacilli bacterium]|nr:hypothetical protein [Bacilli bacterium]
MNFDREERLELDLGGSQIDFGTAGVPELTEEERKRRLKEFAQLSRDGKKIYSEIRGKQNSRIIKLENLIVNTLKDIQENEKDDDMYAIENEDYSVEYYRFCNWYIAEKEKGGFEERWGKEVEIFEDILNYGLENEDFNNLFEYFTAKQREELGINADTMPLSGGEETLLRRCEKITSTETDLIYLFARMKEHEGDSWERFEQYL